MTANDKQAKSLNCTKADVVLLTPGLVDYYMGAVVGQAIDEIATRSLRDKRKDCRDVAQLTFDLVEALLEEREARFGSGINAATSVAGSESDAEQGGAS